MYHSNILYKSNKNVCIRFYQDLMKRIIILYSLLFENNNNKETSNYHKFYSWYYNYFILPR